MKQCLICELISHVDAHYLQKSSLIVRIFPVAPQLTPCR